jgi:putative membrane protein
MPFLSEASKQALTAAVEKIESCSSAEVVIAMRARSGSLLHADLLAGCLGALLTLAFLLFSPYPFSLEAILFDTGLFGVLSALVSSRWPGLRYVLTPRGLAIDNVRRAARAEFFDAGIADTRGRTGILVYVSQTERAAEVLADSGVRRAVDASAWESAVHRIQQVATTRRDGVALAEAVAALAEQLGTCLPRRHDDIDELSNKVRGR